MLSASNSSVVTKPAKSRQRNLGYFLAFSFALGAFFSGVQIGQGVNGEGQSANLFSLFAKDSEEVVLEEQKPNLDEFWKVWSLMEDKFVMGSTSQDISEEEKIQGAIDGLVSSYDDPYTVYMPPVDAEAFDENISGNFSGVGMEVGLRDNLITVIAPLPDTPAEGAGIIAGDVIVQIDEATTEGMRIDEAVDLIRGEKGTVVELRVYREGEVEFLTIPITRDTIDIPTVRTERIDDTFVIALYSFNGVAEVKFKNAMLEFLQSGIGNLVVDVRGNPGGYLQSAVAISGYFLPAGKVVVKEEFGDSDKNDVFRTRSKPIAKFTPENLVVLIDNGSASASEILAGALKDHQVATIIGTQSFGKGSVQELVELETGASLKVTVARWLTPNGTSISDGGLSPDIVISRTPDQRLEEIDPQLDAAIQFLAGKEVESESITDLLEAEATSTPKTGE